MMLTVSELRAPMSSPANQTPITGTFRTGLPCGIASVHLHLAGAEAAAVEVELHVGVVREERHRHGAVRITFPDHQRGEPLPERAVVRAGLPDGDLFGLPRLNGTDGQGWSVEGASG